MKRILYFVAMSALLITFSGIAFANVSDRPDFDVLIKKVQEATDPQDITLNLKTKVQTGVIDMPAQKFKANTTVEYALPDKCRITAKLSNGETNVQIINGNKGWELKDGKVRVISGEELNYLIFNTRLDSFRANWKTLFSKITFEKDQKVSDRDCYVLKCTPAKEFGIDTTVVFYVDKKDFLIRKTEMSAYSQAGVLREVVVVNEYKKMDKVMVPVVTQTDILGAKIVYVITSVEFNSKLSDSLFEPPVQK
jgi:outer membrane lipoprotein-sorting protein